MIDIADELIELTEQERDAKRVYDDALDALETAEQIRAENPCQKTLAKMIISRKRVDEAMGEWREAREEFQQAWNTEFGSSR